MDTQTNSHTSRLLTCTLLFFFALAPLYAQKELKPLRSYIKSGKSADALKEAERLSKDSLWRTDPQVYSLAFQAHRLAYDAQNEKMYLHQTADTAALFAAIRGMYTTAYQCEKYERLLIDSIQRKPRYRSTHAAVLHELIPNLQAAATYCYQHGQFVEAEEAAYLLLRTASDSVFWDKIPCPQLTPLQRQLTSLIHVQGNYHARQYDRMFTHADEALLYKPARAEVLEELAVARLALGDTAAYRDTLTHAIREYPDRVSLFTRLDQYYGEHQMYVSLLNLSNDILAADSARMDARQAEAYALYMLRRNNELVEAAEGILHRAPNDPRGNFYLATVMVERAKAVPIPTRRSKSDSYRSLVAQRSEWYTKALQPMQKYREACPDKVAFWAPALYDIYLNLNMGAEFEEISHILRTLQ